MTLTRITFYFDWPSDSVMVVMMGTAVINSVASPLTRIAGTGLH